MCTILSPRTLGQVQQSVVPLEYSLMVNKVRNIRLPVNETGKRVKLCWVRKTRVIETSSVLVKDGTANFQMHQLKMIARMDYNPNSRALDSKLTYLQLKTVGTNERIIAEVEFDLAAYANKEIFDCRL